jgi:hypothetical protein
VLIHSASASFNSNIASVMDDSKMVTLSTATYLGDDWSRNDHFLVHDSTGSTFFYNGHLDQVSPENPVDFEHLRVSSETACERISPESVNDCCFHVFHHSGVSTMLQSQRILSLCLALTGAACAAANSDPDGGVGSGSNSGGLEGSGGSLSGASGGGTTTGGAESSGGAPSSGGALSTGGAGATGGTAAGTGGSAGNSDPCAAAGLTWKTARKTNYESYPEPGSEECVVYNGCEWAGWFAGCENQQTEAWVESHNIAAFFPNFGTYELHDICIRQGDKTMVVTIYDTCGDSDCSGCCTENKGSADALIDLEKSTNQRWGLPDGQIEWADLGPTSAGSCE